MSDYELLIALTQPVKASGCWCEPGWEAECELDDCPRRPERTAMSSNPDQCAKSSHCSNPTLSEVERHLDVQYDYLAEEARKLDINPQLVSQSHLRSLTVIRRPVIQRLAIVTPVGSLQPDD